MALLALPATPTALAADGTGDGVTDGLTRSYEHHTHGPRLHAGGPRGEGHPARGQFWQWGQAGQHEDAPVTAPAPISGPAVVPAATPPADPQTPAAAEPAAPRIEIGTALGPVSGSQAAGSATSAATAAAQSGPGDDIPLLSFDAPSAFDPRSLAGRLRGAPGARTVQVAIRRGGPVHGCGWWTARSARFTSARRGGCAAPRWMPATLRRVAGGWRWRAAIGASLEPGSYRFLVRVLDASGEPVSFRRA